MGSEHPHFPFLNNAAPRVDSLILPILAGLGAGLAFWVLAAVAEGLFTDQRNVFSELFHPLPADLITRLIVVICCVGFTTMYARSRRSESKFRLSQHRLHTIVEAEPECVKLLDAQGCLLEMNPAGLRMIEVDSLDQVRGQCIYPIVAEKYRDAFIALTKQVFEGQSGRLDFEIIGFKGSRRWLETSAVPLYDRNNKSKIDSLLAITRDVTVRKHAEQELQRSQHRLVRAEILGRIGNWERDLSTNALIWSDEMYRLVGLEPGDPKGTFANFLAMVHPEDRELVKRLTAEAIREGKPYSVQYRLHREKDGADLIIQATAEVVRDQHDKPFQLVGLAQDITALKRAEESLREAKETAEKANHTKDLFLATLSHELRTPLTAILSWTQMLKSGRLDPSKTGMGLQAIEDSTLSQNQLISDLLDVSSLNATKNLG